LPFAARVLRVKRSDRSAFEQDEDTQEHVRVRHERRRVLVTPTNKAWVGRESHRTKEKGHLPERQRGNGQRSVREVVGANQWYPNGQTVAAPPNREREGSHASAAKLFTRLGAMTPRVQRVAKGRHAQDPNPAQGKGSEERGDAAGENNDRGDSH